MSTPRPGIAARGGLALGLSVAVAIFLADQASKWWVLEGLRLPEIRNLSVFQAGPFGLDFTMVWNRGVTFGLLAGDAAWAQLALAVGAAVIALVLLRWMARAETRAVAAALGAVVGGALGNVVDRARFGAVVDFVRAHAWGWDWYVFNLADAAIVVGVVTLLLDALFRRAPDAKSPA